MTIRCHFALDLVCDLMVFLTVISMTGLETTRVTSSGVGHRILDGF